MSSSVDLYYTAGSPPSRAVLMAAEALAVPIGHHHLNLANGEHMTPDFLKLNPQHTVPVMNDNGLVITESRAIITYLADKYGKDESLYPKCIKKRALVNQRLYFDIGTLYQRFSDYYYPYLFAQVPLDSTKKEKLDEAFGFLEGFLEKTRWVAGDAVTVADFCLVSSVSTIQITGYDLSAYPAVVAWLERAKTDLPYSANQKGLEAFKGMVDYLLSTHKK